MTRKINYTTIPRDWLVAEYHLDWNANATVWTNGAATNVTWWTDWTIAYQKGYWIFNGSSSYITIPNNSIFDLWANYSIEIRCNITALPTSWNLQTLLYRLNTAWNWAQFEFVLFNDWWVQKIFVSHATTFNPINYTLPTWKWINLWVKYWSNTITFTLDWVIIWTVSQSTAPWTSNKQFAIWVNYQPSNNRFFNWKIQTLRIYNRTITEEEEKNFQTEFQRKLWPSNAILSWDFPLYSLPNLEQWKVLEISKPKVGSNYINQVDWSSYTATNVTDSTNGKYNVMSFTSWWITWSSLSFSTSVCYENISWKWEFKLNPTYITSTWVTSWTREIANIKCWNRILSTTEIEQFKYWSKIV